MATPLHNQTDSRGRKQGPWEELNSRGELEKGHYQDGIRRGVWKGYSKGDYHYKPGEFFSEIFYENGKMYLYKKYWSGGRLLEEAHYKNGKLHGPYKKLLPGGSPWTEGQYKNDKRHGHWKFYHEAWRSLEREGTYLKGEQEGLWKRYWSTGSLLGTGHYKNDMKYGLWKYYEKDGTLDGYNFYIEDEETPSSLLLLLWLNLL